MTPIFNPLRDKAELLNTHAQPYQHAFDQIADIISFADLAACPICQRDDMVDFVQVHNNPEHGEYSIAISCGRCAIHTHAQHWFISSPSSAVSALNTALQFWHRLTVTRGDSEPVIASAAKQSERRDKFNPTSDPVIPAHKGPLPANAGTGIQPRTEVEQDAICYRYLLSRLTEVEHDTHIDAGMIRFQFSGSPYYATGHTAQQIWDYLNDAIRNGSKNNEPVIPAQAGIQSSLDIIQDAARYQEIKRIIHGWHISFAFLKGKPDHLVIDLSIASEVIETHNNETSALEIDLDQTIDNSIAATQQPEAAK